MLYYSLAMHASLTLKTNSFPSSGLWSSYSRPYLNSTKQWDTSHIPVPYPMPQLSQQVSRSWEEISTLTLPPLWIHTRSEMASAAPNACGQKNQQRSQTIKYKPLKQGNRPNVVKWDHPTPPHPAGSTGALVSDLLQSGTVGPLLSGVKAFRQLQVSSILNPAQENSIVESNITVCYHCVTHNYNASRFGTVLLRDTENTAFLRTDKCKQCMYERQQTFTLTDTWV